jgi:predicted site-specific integrase-resolvase
MKPLLKRLTTPSEPHMKLSLSQAAKETGSSKATLSRWIAKGRISGEKQPNGSYKIDPSELDRIKDLMGNGNGIKKPNLKRMETPSETHNETSMLRREIELLHEQRQRDYELIDDLRRRLDQESEERRKLTMMLTDMRPKAPQKPVESLRVRLARWIAGTQ